jgi:hypothetical protein
MESVEKIEEKGAEENYKSHSKNIDVWLKGLHALCSDILAEKKTQILKTLGLAGLESKKQSPVIKVTLRRLVKNNYKSVSRPTQEILERARRIDGGCLAISDATLEKALGVIMAVRLARLVVLAPFESCCVSDMDQTGGGYIIVDSSYNKNRHTGKDHVAVCLMPALQVQGRDGEPISQTNPHCIICRHVSLHCTCSCFIVLALPQRLTRYPAVAASIEPILLHFAWDTYFSRVSGEIIPRSGSFVFLSSLGL